MRITVIGVLILIGGLLVFVVALDQLARHVAARKNAQRESIEQENLEGVNEQPNNSN